VRVYERIYVHIRNMVAPRAPLNSSSVVSRCCAMGLSPFSWRIVLHLPSMERTFGPSVDSHYNLPAVGSAAASSAFHAFYVTSFMDEPHQDIINSSLQLRYEAMTEIGPTLRKTRRKGHHGFLSLHLRLFSDASSETPSTRNLAEVLCFSLALTCCYMQFRS
jgi:hypothetical protein